MTGTRAVLSLGSNLGDRARYLANAVAALGGLGADVRSVSPVYQAPPWGDADQPDYLNAVVIADSRDDDPRHWLRVVRRLEAAAGRERDPGRRYGPRTLDVDVIAVFAVGTVGTSSGGAVVGGAVVGGAVAIVSDDPELVLPHPRAHLRAFVLRPWLDVQPDAVLPGHATVAQLLRTGPVAGDAAALRPRPEVRLATIGRLDSAAEGAR